MRRFALVLQFALVLLLLVGVTAALARPVPPSTPVGPDRTLTVMARNIYFGADLAPALAAQSSEEFFAAAVGAFEEAQASDFPARAAAIADEIVADGPALVGIQEATWWRTGPFQDPAPAEDVLVDFVGLILAELDQRGASYEAIATVEGFDAELPVDLGPELQLDIRLTVGDVMLARTDLRPAELALSNIQTGTFGAMVSLPSPVGQLDFPRQWISVDAKSRGLTTRVITTHLESISAAVRTAQAVELLAGPASTSLPVVAMGDFNAETHVAGDASATMLAAGFVDAWDVAGDGPGLTCCQDADLRNETSALDKRIDLVLTRGDFGVNDVRVVGDEPQPGLSALGVLYPSDHAGVVADLVLPRPGR
jgi:endonuclease/exonuclease/phosphatase family metal-dependent hydrolase